MKKTRKTKEQRLIEKLEEALLREDNEEVHMFYDKLILMRLRKHDPSYIRRLDRLFKGKQIAFYYV